MINRQTVVVRDVSKDDRIPCELHEGTFVRAAAMAPVRAEDPVGAIGAYWSQPYTPSDAEIATLEALADAAAAAIEGIDLSAGPEKSSVSKDDAAAGDGLPNDLDRDIARVKAIAAVPNILDIALRMTGMGFAAVARVTEDRWITCQSLDHVAFGLKAGHELPVRSTICDEIRGHRNPVVIDDVADDTVLAEHHSPKTSGLKSYISVPIILADRRFFGTL